MAAELSPEDIVDLQRLFETGRAGALSRTMFNTITDTALALKAAKAELARVIEERDSEKSRANSIDAELVSVLRGKMALEDRFGNGHETLTATLERLTAELARVTAERDEARERAKTLYTAASCVASAIAVKHAHYEDAHREPKPRRAISVDEANWRRLLDAGCEGDTAYLDDHLAAKAEIATARADALARRVEGLEALASRLGEWTHVYGAALVPHAPWTDSYGDGIRSAKEQVTKIIDAALAASSGGGRCPAILSDATMSVAACAYGIGCPECLEGTHEAEADGCCCCDADLCHAPGCEDSESNGWCEVHRAPSPAPEPNRFRCPACPAAPVIVDEDGCCATCGADAEPYFDADAADPAPSGGEAKVKCAACRDTGWVDHDCGDSTCGYDRQRCALCDAVPAPLAKETTDAD